MRQRVLVAHLIRLDHRFAARVGKFDGAVFAVPKITRSDLPPVESQRDDPQARVGDEDEHGRRVEEEWRNRRIIFAACRASLQRLRSARAEVRV